MSAVAAGSSRKKKLGLFGKLLILGVAIYISVAFIQLQVDLNERRSELSLLKQQLAEQDFANQELKTLVDMRQNDEYIERVARDRLDYAYPEERIYIDISGE